MDYQQVSQKQNCIEKSNNQQSSMDHISSGREASIRQTPGFSEARDLLHNSEPYLAQLAVLDQGGSAGAFQWGC